MHVEDLMTREVVSAQPETTLKEVAAMLVQHRITGLPVCDSDGQVLGVVSEADILYKQRGRVERGGFMPGLFEGTLAAEATKIAARTAGETMTSPAITIGPRQPVTRAAQLMLEHGVNRLPVLEEGELVGIVTRADLVRAFTRSDAEIEHELREKVIKQTLWLDPDSIEIQIEAGVVRLTSAVQARTDALLIERFAERLTGVVSVESRLIWETDDTAGRRGIGAVRAT